MVNDNYTNDKVFIRGFLMDCKKCKLHKTRTNIVKGYGNEDSDIMLIGEAPGRNEDINGKPFVGRAGIILDNMLELIGLTREDVYITNIVKCRPPNNRNPTGKEIESCSIYLDMELDRVNPSIIIPMGKFASRYILNKFGKGFTSMSNVRGIRIEMSGKTICPIYHPAALIYNNSLMDVMKKDVLEIGKLI